jgi:hypothetical protein
MRPPRDVRELFPHLSRRADILRLVKEVNPTGVELGVAEGTFSERLVAFRKPQLMHLYSIDMWRGDRGHDTEEYKKALRRLLPYRERSTVLRLSFAEALDLFPDANFDFIYVDGYAHTGQENGRTLREWWPKLKPGGLFAGDDYRDQWPLVMEEVDRFVNERGLDLLVFTPTEIEDKWSQSPTWLVIKPS